MNKIVLYIASTVFLLGVLFRIFFALIFPDRIAEGARKVLFIDEREKALFRTEKKMKYNKDNEESNIRNSLKLRIL